MKALSLRQPWASLIGPKKHETRSWPTTFRGTLVIHASKTFTDVERAICLTTPFKDLLIERGLIVPTSLDGAFEYNLPLGALLSTCFLTDCVPTEQTFAEVPFEERHFVDAIDWLMGDYSAKRYAYELAEFKNLPKPVPYKGRQRFFEVPDEVIAAAFAQKSTAKNA